MHTSWVPIDIGCIPDYSCGYVNASKTDFISCVALNMSPVHSPETLKGIAPEPVLGHLQIGGRVVYFSVDVKKEHLKAFKELFESVYPSVDKSELLIRVGAEEKVRIVFWINHDDKVSKKLTALFNILNGRLPDHVLEAFMVKASIHNRIRSLTF